MPDEELDDAAQAGPPLESPAEPDLGILRHSAAHLLAAAVVELFPGAQYDVGPAIADGFFYNFRLPDGGTFSEEDLGRIGERMSALAARRIPFEREVVPRDQARIMFAGMSQSFKVDIIDRMGDQVDSVGIYRTGDFVDLCRGPHVPDSGWLGAVRLRHARGKSAVPGKPLLRGWPPNVNVSLTRVLAATGDGFCVVDRAWRIVFLNRSARVLLETIRWVEGAVERAVATKELGEHPRRLAWLAEAYLLAGRAGEAHRQMVPLPPGTSYAVRLASTGGDGVWQSTRSRSRSSRWTKSAKRSWHSNQ